MEMLWTSSSTVFVGVLITPLPVMKKKISFVVVVGLAVSKNHSSASMTGNNPVTLTGL